MKSQLSHTFISFLVVLVILVVSEGTSFAGSLFCSLGCSECGVVPICCAEMENNSMSGTRGAAGHSPERTGCSHDGICFSGFQPIDVSTGSATFEYANTFVLSHLSYELDLENISRAIALILPRSPIDNFPPLFLRICSFLI